MLGVCLWRGVYEHVTEKVGLWPHFSSVSVAAWQSCARELQVRMCAGAHVCGRPCFFMHTPVWPCMRSAMQLRAVGGSRCPCSPAKRSHPYNTCMQAFFT